MKSLFFRLLVSLWLAMALLVGAFAAILPELFDRARASAVFLADPRRRARYLAELAAAGGAAD